MSLTALCARSSLALALVVGACQRDIVTPCSSCTAPPAPAAPDIVWRASGSTAVRPVVDDRAVYVLGTHVVFAFDKSTGASLWSTPLAVPNPESFLQGYGTALAAGLLIIGDIDVFGLDPATGAIRWQFAPRTQFPNERSFQRLTTDGTTVYVGGVWGNVYAVDAATGAQRWIAHVTTLPDSTIRVFNPVVDNGVVYVAFADSPPGKFEIDGGAAAFDAATGRLLWSQYLPRHFSGPTETESVTLTPTRVVTGSWDGYLYGLDRQTGVVVDSIPKTVFGFTADNNQDTIFQLLTVGDTLVLAGTDNSKITAFDGRNLTQLLWQVSFRGSPFDLAVDSTMLYVNYGGTIFGAMSLTTHKFIWMVGPNPGPEYFMAAPAFDRNRLYIGSDRNIFALTPP